MLSAGRLNQRIAIEAQIVSRGPSNEKVVTWTPVIPELWAEVKPMSVTGLLAAQALQSQATYVITIRYRTDIDRKMRVRRLRDDMIFAIEAEPLPDDRSGLEWVTLHCSQGLNDGE
ncbi:MULTISPECIES: phage head closure protein [Hydrocarboniphaga]|uniref:Phage head-tail adaptor n=1 Tax=Hydrocarboniphaga effusa AP103 TaxID=1172194 RepID=I7ZE65_9GAMM|nr:MULTISPECIES: phage head closure protein [Hydrocarboniphaga]EIT70002.1 hypothetical protein WQQ_01390 [Hydrocarboniphaga effusa AP103]EIT70189.1 hypothetical protein WQQ_03260 [Hydrocarboniphaga effusa AP103]MDZ4077181.1 phage head closure protein [Hydrocarboniphaga sp.]